MFNLVLAVLFNQITFCPLCGTVLVQIDQEVKKCLQSCGQARVAEHEGLPVIVFEVP